MPDRSSQGPAIRSAYGRAHFGKSLFWYAAELLFAFFLTEYAGLSGAQMATAIAAGLILAGGIDIAIGVGLRGRLASAKDGASLQLHGAVLSSAALIAVLLIVMVDPQWRFTYAILTGIAFRLSFAVYDISQNAMMALATNSSADRKDFAATRIWYSGIATLLVALLISPTIAMVGDTSGTYFLIAAGASFCMIAIASAWRLSKLIPTCQLPVATPRTSAGPSDVSVLWSAPFVLFCLLMIATSLFTPTFSKLEPYFAARVLDSPVWGGVIIASMSLGLFVGQPGWRKLAGARSFFSVMVGACALQMAALGTFAIFAASRPEIGAVAAFAFGLGNGGVGMALWGGFSELLSSRGPHTGLGYALFSAVAKFALAGNIAIVGWIVAQSNQGNATSDVLPTAMAVLPALGALGVLLCMLALRAAENERIKGGRSSPAD